MYLDLSHSDLSSFRIKNTTLHFFFFFHKFLQHEIHMYSSVRNWFAFLLHYMYLKCDTVYYSTTKVASLLSSYFNRPYGACNHLAQNQPTGRRTTKSWSETTFGLTQTNPRIRLYFLKPNKPKMLPKFICNVDVIFDPTFNVYSAISSMLIAVSYWFNKPKKKLRNIRVMRLELKSH